MPARTPVGARIIVADKEAARAMGAPALVWAKLNLSRPNCTPRAVRNVPGAARKAWGKTDGAKLVAEMPARAPNAVEIPGARNVAEMPARTPVGARIIVADKEAARAPM